MHIRVHKVLVASIAGPPKVYTETGFRKHTSPSKAVLGVWEDVVNRSPMTYHNWTRRTTSLNSRRTEAASAAEKILWCMSLVRIP